MPYRGLAATAVLFTLSLAALAVTPHFWENFAQEELLKGTLTHVSLTSDGKLQLAPAFDLVFDTGQPYIFSIVRDKAGNIYVGTGSEGKVFKIDSQGNGSLYFQSKELDVFALALDAADILYVGTSPDGKVYKVSGANQATEFCDPEDKYIWAMSFDTAGNLYIGTGPRGVIYKVDKTGKKSTFYTCSDNHVVVLVQGNNNSLLAGTSPDGLIVEITPEGKGFTLFDSPMEEIRSLAMDRFGTIYAIGSSSKGITPPSAPKPGPTLAPVISISPMTIQSLAGLSEKPKEAKSTVNAPGGEKESVRSEFVDLRYNKRRQHRDSLLIERYDGFRRGREKRWITAGRNGSQGASPVDRCGETGHRDNGLP